MNKKFEGLIFSWIGVMIDYVFFALIIIFSPVASLSRRIGLSRLPHTKKILSCAGIDFIWPTNKDPVIEDLFISKPVSIVFQGGLGAQIISASVYLYLRNRGYKIFADFNYFGKEVYLASSGDGRFSQWEYRLDGYGLPFTFFENINDCVGEDIISISDGALKAQLFQKAMSDPDVKKYFPLSKSREILDASDFFGLNSIDPYSYICMHVRRGDYLNSDVHHIVPEDNFLEISGKFAKLYSTIVVASDSKLSKEFKSKVKKIFPSALFLDDMALDELTTHSVMRLASVLICSNSQFSMTAGSLSGGIAFIPIRFFEGAHQQDLAKVLIEKFAKFSLLNL